LKRKKPHRTHPIGGAFFFVYTRAIVRPRAWGYFTSQVSPESNMSRRETLQFMGLVYFCGHVIPGYSTIQRLYLIEQGALFQD